MITKPIAKPQNHRGRERQTPRRGDSRFQIQLEEERGSSVRQSLMQTSWEPWA